VRFRPLISAIRTVRGGSARYVEVLTRTFGERVRLHTPVDAVTRHVDHVLVKPRGGEAERFDEVVLATHSDQALVLLRDASDREHGILGAIPYQPNEAVLHTDVRMLRRRAWASWNYHLLAEPKRATTVTYHMNRLQSWRAEREFCVTLNRTAAIAPDKVIRTISYAHPVHTAAEVQAQAGVDLMRLVRGVDADRVRVPARIAIRLKHSDLMPPVQQMRDDQAGASGTNNSNSHFRDQPRSNRTDG
jgi:predicted NAD/FAD-binding protein